MNRLIKKYLFFLLFLLSTSSIFSQLSKTHYIPPVTGVGGGSGADAQTLYISTPSASPVNFTVRYAGVEGATATSGKVFQSDQVDNTNPYEVVIAGGINNVNYSEIFVNSSEVEIPLNKGLIVEADSEIYVSYRFISGNKNQAAAIVSKGTSALGTRFRAGMLLNNTSSSNGHIGFISVMATENNTTIDFDLPDARITTNGTGDHSVTIDKFQSYIIANTSSTYSLIGSLISSDKPIVVNTGAFGTFDVSSGGQDYGMDQIVDASLVGSEYIFIEGIADNEIETVLIVADQDNTTVNVNGTFYDNLINAGDFLIIKGDKFNGDGNLYVNTDDPNDKLFAFQGTGRNYIIGGAFPDLYKGANQGMYFVPPLNCATRGDVDNIPRINEVSGETFNEQATVTFITKDGATILVNGSDVTGPPYNASSRQVDGNSDYVTYKVESLSGNIKVEGNDELYVAYVNSDGAATTAGFYSGFTIPPTVDLDADLKTLGSCLNKDGTSNVVFEASNFSQFDSIEWLKKDASGNFVAIPGETGQFYTPTDEGDYKLKGILACNNAEYFSPEISVSICPDDFDKDGVIDNIDLDLDNDGILNSNESDGDVTFDFSDYNNPALTSSRSITATATTSNLTTGTTGKSITGLIDGEFETEMPVTTIDEFSYKLEFSENLNIKFTSQSIAHSIVDGEYFELKVDGDRNITLLDPKNHLIVKQPGSDDFTELEEVGGEKIYSSNTIRFKFNSSVSSLPEFEFIGYDLSEIQFTHFADNTSSSSIFKGKIEGINLAINTDTSHPTNSDTIPDYFDLDSDGDDCFDVTEAGFDDVDGDGILGEGVPTYDDLKVDTRGRVTDPVHDYDSALILKDAVSGVYYFQQVGQAVSITPTGQPTNQAACIGENAEFEVEGNHPSGVIYYQWQFLDSTTGIWNDLDGTNAKITGWDSDKLEISDVDSTLAGEYRVQLKTDEYQCTTDSNSGVSLTVNTPPDTPIVEPIQTFCFNASTPPNVGDLVISPPPANPTGLTISVYDDYDPTDPTIGTLLDPNDALVDGQYYYIQVTDASSCSSSGRRMTKALISNPDISASLPESCPGDPITLTADNVPQTALDFELANPTLTKLTDTWTDSNGVISYYFYEKVNRSWEDSFDLIASYGVGASMYQISDPAEHDAVWGAIVSMGINGTEPFWLGLKQSGTKTNAFDSGWEWLNGDPLDPSWNLWDTRGSNNEPNDYDFTRPAGCSDDDCDGVEDGSEDYGHFNNSSTKLLNDYPNSVGGGSYSLYEFSGTTTVKWYYQLADDPANPGYKGPKTAIPGNLTEIDVNPDVTTIYILEVTTNNVTCRVEYEHIVNPLPVPTAVGDLELCDEIDLTADPNSTNTDGISYSFDLDSQTPLIVDGQVDRDGNPFTVTYHETLTDAQDITKTGLSSPYTNVLNPAGSPYDPQTIYVRLLDEATGCFDTSLTFDIIVNPTPESNPVVMPEVCDDTDSGSDVDGSSKFDLTTLENDILGAAQVAAGGFIVTYHLSQAEANDPLSYPDGITDPAAHYNTPDSSFDPANPTVQTEEIFVRVTDTNVSTVCFRADTSFTLTVNPLPVLLKSSHPDEECDNPLFDLTYYEDILSKYPSTETFSYYKIDSSGTRIDISPADAENYTSSGTSITAEIIYVDISKNSGGCSRTAQIELKVSYNQVPDTYAQSFIDANKIDLFKTDGQTIIDSDLSGQSQNGKEEFDTAIFQNIIDELKALDPANFGIPNIDFKFYGSEREAKVRQNPIDLTKAVYVSETERFDVLTGKIQISNYNASKNRWEQEIWIRITDNNVTAECTGLQHVTTLYVEKRPVIYDVVNPADTTKPNDVLLLCDEQISLDRFSEFDTSTLENLL